ncbi:MAG TPA: sugar ABC transporter substrate-binding protein [Chloroflexota bacterium]|nr:sugar ABC transporter substrate-binding protein [Chloroflexota bacterium]
MFDSIATSRRSFLRGLASSLLMGASAAVVACSASPAAPPTAASAPTAPASAPTKVTTPASTTAPAAAPTSAPTAASAATQPTIAATAPAKTTGPVEISYVTWWLPPLNYGTGTNQAIGNYQKANPNVTVKIIPVPGPPAAQLQKLQTLLAAGTPPDIALMRPFHQNAFAAKNVLRPVDDLFKTDQGLNRDDFWPQTMSRLTYKGKLSGLPAEMWVSFIMYNLDLLNKAGVKPPPSDWTWDQFLDLATKLTQASGANKQYGCNQPDWEMVVWSQGGNILNGDETKCILDQPPAPEAIQWDADLILKSKVAPGPDALQGQSPQSMFETGRVGLYTIANWYIGDAKTNAKFPWDIALMPSGKIGRVPVVQGANYAVMKDAKNSDAALAFMSYMSAGDGQKTMITGTGLFPTVKSLAKPEFLTNYKPEWITLTLDSLKTARARNFVPQYDEMSNEFDKELSIVWTGKQTAAEAIKKIVPVVNQILASSP